MTATTPTTNAGVQRRNVAGLVRDYPLLPLSVLLTVLVVAVEIGQPGTVTPNWVGVVIRASVPLAILTACQTLTMLTGGIDLSVGYVASMVGFVTTTYVNQPGGAGLGMAVGLLFAVMAGLVNGIGIGLFRVHPLIMTLGMGLVVLGFANVWQLEHVQTGSGTPDFLRQLGVGLYDNWLPYSLLVGVPLALILIFGLRRTGYGRTLYALGDNPVAARLSGVRSWQVLLVLYVISAVLAAIAGWIYIGLGNVANVTLVQSQLLPSVAAAVIGGVSIAGGRGTYTGAIFGTIILTVLGAFLTIMGLPEPFRQIIFGSIVVLVAAAYTRVTAEA